MLNKRETALAQARQEQHQGGICTDWVWKEPERLDGAVQRAVQRHPAAHLRRQRAALCGHEPGDPAAPAPARRDCAHALYGGNTLLAHVVGAGQDLHDGCCRAWRPSGWDCAARSMFVVPNHLTEQWAAEFLRLYPVGEYSLSPRRRTLRRRNRRRFCSRIATGDYDAVIIGHSQFEKIPLSAGAAGAAFCRSRSTR